MNNGFQSMGYGDYPDLSNVRRVLVVKLRQIGDVLLTTPVFRALQEALPEAQVDVYVYSESVEMLEQNPHIDKILSYDRKWKRLGFFQRVVREWTQFRKIRSSGYDLVINLTEGDRGAWMARLSKASIRVGFEPKGRLQKGFYTHLVKHCPTPRHTVEKNLDALRRIGIFPEEESRELFLSLSSIALDKMAHLLGKLPFILIHPTSRWRFKCWPVLKMRQLIEALLQMGKRVVISSGPDPFEREMVEEITTGLDVVNLSGKLSLKELAALIAISELLVCVDSLPFHMASALKKKVVALFGPTSNVTWGPWRNPQAQVLFQNWSCRPCYLDGCGGSKRSDCLVTLPIERVLRAITESFPQNRCVLQPHFE